MSLPEWRTRIWDEYTEPTAPWFRLLEEIVDGQPDDLAARRAGLLPEDLLYVLSLAYDSGPHRCWTKWAEGYQVAVGEREGNVVKTMAPSTELTRVVAPSVAQRAETPLYVAPAASAAAPGGSTVNLIFRDPALPPGEEPPVLEAEFDVK